MRYGSEHKSETRKRVLKEAARAIRAKGPEGVAVAGIMARAGLTHGGFYAHFRSKDDLIAETISVMFDDTRSRFFKITDNTDPKEALTAYIDHYLSKAHRDARDRGCPLPALSADMARLEPASREQFGAGISAMIERMASMLDAIGVKDTEAAASAALAQLVGALALSRAVSDPHQSDALLAATRADLKHRFNLGECDE